jgi:ABC-type multidrug transport system fused ATPase/permease subunit
MYTIVYGMSAVIILVLQLCRSFMFVRSTLKASSTLHLTVFNAIMRAPMTFFDSTPTGRILNRFSSDLDSVDVQLPLGMEILVQNITLLILALVMVGWALPWFLIACIPVFAVFRYIVYYFGPAQRELKRLDNVSRSPLFSTLMATFQGLNVIHAFHKSKDFQAQFSRLLDSNTQAFFGFNFAGRWFAYRLGLFAGTCLAAHN